MIRFPRGQCFAVFVVSVFATYIQAASKVGVIEFEAENVFSNNGWTFSTEIPGFSGSGYMAPPLSHTNDLQYKINFPSAGKYYVFARGYAETWRSIQLGLNGVRGTRREDDPRASRGLNGYGTIPPIITNFADPAIMDPGLWGVGATRFNLWGWHGTWYGSGGNFRLYIDVPSAGEQLVNIWPREGAFSLDKVILTKNVNYSPEADDHFWKKQSIYQIITDRFFDGDSSNNDASAAVSISLNPPVPGSNCTINYFPANRLLATAPAVNLHIGHSGWQGVISQAMVRNGSGWTANFSVPTNASSIQFVFNDGGSIWDNNNGTDWNLPISVTMSPDPPVAGRPVRITYRPVSRPLANASSVNLHLGFNNWANFVGSFPMNRNGATYNYDYLVPTNATNLSFVFNDGGSVWDNNGGQDWRPATQSTASFMSRRQGGDFKGIEEKLDYIKALGFTAIWISPVLYNGKGDYHGYAATDFYKVDPRFGTLDDLKRLVEKAHEKGLLVINDVVVNHGSTLIGSTNIGWQTTFKDPPDGYPLSFEGSSSRYAPPFDASDLESIFNNNGQTLNWGDARQVERGELLGLDDFRTESSFVRQKMQEIYSYWIQEVGFDGFRIDTVKHVEMGFWNQWCPALRSSALSSGNVNFFNFGEVYDGNDQNLFRYVGSLGLDSLLDYPLYFQINPVFAKASAGPRVIAERWGRLDSETLSKMVTFIDNHDQPRFLHEANQDTRKLDLALVYLFTGSGIPCLYYGTEQDFAGGHDPLNREPMFGDSSAGGDVTMDRFDMTSARFKLIMKLNLLRKNFLLGPWRPLGSEHRLSNSDYGGYPLTSVGRGSFPRHEIILAEDGPGLLIYGITTTPVGNQASFGHIVIINSSPTAKTTPQIPALGESPITVPPLSYQIIGNSLDLPYVEVCSPRHGLNNVSPVSKIVLEFNLTMDTNSVQSAFSTTPQTQGTFSWSSSNKIMTYLPSQLSNNTLYTISLDKTAADASGRMFYNTNPRGEIYAWSYLPSKTLMYNTTFVSTFRTGSSNAESLPKVLFSKISASYEDSALLSFTVNPNGQSASHWIEYGPTESYGTTTAAETIPAGTTPINLERIISGLNPSSVYYARAAANNTNGTVYGPALRISTLSPAIVATTKEAINVGASFAQLGALLMAGGGDSSSFFEYGLHPDRLDSTSQNLPPGSGSGLIEQSMSLSELQPATTYYYRLVTVSGNQTNRSTLQSFTTASVKPSLGSLFAEAVTMDSATLRFSANPNGSATSIQAEYSTNELAWTSAFTRNLPGSLATFTNLSAQLTGLTPRTKYFWRIVSSNTHGITTSSNLSFLTSHPLPVVQNSLANTIGSNSASVSGVIDPRGLGAGYWIEYGPLAQLGFSTARVSADNAEGYSALGYSTPDNQGGSGFGPFTSAGGYLSVGGLALITSSSPGSSANRQIEGSRSFAISAGAGTRGSHAGYRPLLSPGRIGFMEFSLRVDTDNSTGFAGLNLKSSQHAEFPVGELVSLGMKPWDGQTGGNRQIVLSDAAGWQAIDFEAGTDLRGQILDCQLLFDCEAGDYLAKIKLRSESMYREVSGRLKNYGFGVQVAAVGYLNANSTGAAYQNLIWDGLRISFYDPLAGSGAVSGASSELSGLNAGTEYFYRVGAFNLGGVSYGPTQSFFSLGPLSGIDAWRQAWFGSPNNSGSAADSASATGDGIANLIKYALDLNPTQPATNRIITAGTNDGNFRIAFTRKKDALDITYRVEAANDLSSPSSWQEIWTSATNAYPGGESATAEQIVQDVVPMNSVPQGKRFLRLKISKP